MKPTPLHALRENVYEPYEDSFFLLDCLEKDQEFLKRFRSPFVAEIGTGSGIVSSFVPQLIEKYFPMASDISINALECALETWDKNWKNNDLEVVRGDLLSFLRPNLVDILIFNPPYVPSENVPQLPVTDEDDKWVDLALDGGENGMQVTQCVLENLNTYLSATGVAYILFCASNKPEEVARELKNKGFDAVPIDKRRAGWEILSVYRICKLET